AAASGPRISSIVRRYCCASSRRAPPDAGTKLADSSCLICENPEVWSRESALQTSRSPTSALVTSWPAGCKPAPSSGKDEHAGRTLAHSAVADSNRYLPLCINEPHFPRLCGGLYQERRPDPKTKLTGTEFPHDVSGSIKKLGASAVVDKG